MIRLRILKIGLAAVFGAAVSQGLHTPAYAQIVDLACSHRGSSGVDLYVSIDMSARTVAWWFPPMVRENAYMAPATITDDKVIWYKDFAGLFSTTSTLDRNIGVLTMEDSDSPQKRQWECKKASRAF